jgi:hypothetical protein
MTQHGSCNSMLYCVPATNAPQKMVDGISAVCCCCCCNAGWALAVVSSRAFRVAGPQAPAALLPLIDMANHSFEPNCEVLPVPGGVAMVAKRPVCVEGGGDEGGGDGVIMIAGAWLQEAHDVLGAHILQVMTLPIPD